MICCPASAPGCTVRWPGCWPTRSGWPPTPAPRPSWPTTTWPATTSRAPSRRPSGPGWRPSGSAPPLRRTATLIRRWRCGNGSAIRRSWPGWSGGSSPCIRRATPRPAGMCRGPCTSCGACAPRLRPGRMPCSPRRPASGSRTSSCRSTRSTRTRWSPKPSRWPGPPSTCCPRTRRRGNGPGPSPPTPTPCWARRTAPRPSGPSTGWPRPAPRARRRWRRTAWSRWACSSTGRGGTTKRSSCSRPRTRRRARPGCSVSSCAPRRTWPGRISSAVSSAPPRQERIVVVLVLPGQPQPLLVCLPVPGCLFAQRRRAGGLTPLPEHAVSAARAPPRTWAGFGTT